MDIIIRILDTVEKIYLSRIRFISAVDALAFRGIRFYAVSAVRIDFRVAAVDVAIHDAVRITNNIAVDFGAAATRADVTRNSSDSLNPGRHHDLPGMAGKSNPPGKRNSFATGIFEKWLST